MATREDIERWIAAHGGPNAVVYGYEDVEAPNPAFNNPDHPDYQGRTRTPDKIPTRRETWTHRATGATFSAIRTPGAHDEFQDIKETPGTKAAAAADTKAPPGGKPFLDDDASAGSTGRRWGWNPETGAYDRDLGPSPAAQGLGQTAKPAAPKGDIQTIGGRIKEYNPATGQYDIDHGPSTAPKEPEKPQLVAGTLNTTSPNVGIWDPETQTIKWAPNPNAQNPSPQPINIPGNPKYIWWDDGPGKPPRRELNQDYVKPSKIAPHPSDPNRLVNYTVDDNGDPIILPVNDQTVIKPADLPVLQATYGNIATSLGALAQDLNSRYARGEITEDQKNKAFTAAHQQAQTQIGEINTILDTSKAIWSGELTQRGQTLGETQSRRGFAQNIFDRAAATGMGIATSAGPGHGKAIAGGVAALMNMGKQYAEGLGGFRESPEIPLPAALQQARGMSLPGFGPTGAPPGLPPSLPPSSVPPAGAPGLGTAAPGPVPAGVPQSFGTTPPPVGPAAAPRPWTDVETGPSVIAGGVPPVPPGVPQSFGGTPQGALPGVPTPGGTDPGFYRGPPGGGEAQDPGFRWGPPGGGEAQDPGFYRPGPQGALQGLDPRLAQMGQQLLSGQAFGGSPVAAGGPGIYDPTPDIDEMLGAHPENPDWAAAIRAAAAAFNQPGYAWDRFSAPRTRFG